MTSLEKIAEAKTDMTRLSKSFASLDMADRFALIREHWKGSTLATTSFGAQSVVLLHLLKQHAPEIPIVCIDTGYLFPETYHYAETLQNHLDINVEFYTSPVSPARMENTLGRLWEMGRDGIQRYGQIRKVEPMDRALRDHKATTWLSGLRHAHSSDRSQRHFIEKQNRIVKVYPILDWTDERVEAYINEHKLPNHPLKLRGFVSIGDWHSTRKIEPTMRPEDTRNNGLERECGLHIDSNSSDFVI